MFYYLHFSVSNPKYTLWEVIAITTVFSPHEHIRIDISSSESLQGSQVLYPGLWILKSWILGFRPCRETAISALTLLSSDNLLTDYEQLSY